MDKAGTTPKRMAAAAADGEAPRVKGKHKKNREVSPLLDSLEDSAADTPSGRRLRATGKEDKAPTPAPATAGRCSCRNVLRTSVPGL